jgi:hypothetical protein
VTGCVYNVPNAIPSSGPVISVKHFIYIFRLFSLPYTSERSRVARVFMSHAVFVPRHITSSNSEWRI